MAPMITAAVAQRFDIAKEDPEGAPRSLSRSHSFEDRSYARLPLGTTLAPGLRLNWDASTRLPLVTSTTPNRDKSTVSTRVPSSAMSSMLPLSPIGPQSNTWTHTRGPATGIQRAITLSSHPKVHTTQASPTPAPPPARSRAFFDVVLAPPVDIPAAEKTGTTLTDLRAPSKPAPVTSRRAPPAGNSGKKKKKAPKRRAPTPEPEPSSSEPESEFEREFEFECESSEEDVPDPSREPVKLMKDGAILSQLVIPTSNLRGECSLVTCLSTRMEFDREYSTHTRPIVRALATKPSRGSARNVSLPVRKSSRLAATRSATPASTDMDSATDISISFVSGSSRAVSVASTTATASRNKPRPKPKPKTPRSKSASRLSTGSNSSRDQSTPQPMSTSMAYSPDDPPPPAPTNVVSLRPGYNAYTPEDKQWFLDFVGWVFKQNVRAGKAEICQDIFQQAPHHRLESWKSYWRDHISQVEMLRNQARERLPYPESKRKSTGRLPLLSSTTSDRVPAIDEDANRNSEELWKLAELAESQGPVLNRSRSNKRIGDDIAAQQCNKRSRT
ncbi:hypothetical protein BN14_00746 [Rhizoctonia solani AG-1 IB]|uniref:Myb-like domain-containing protein n=1 Tax=Thanatephorus cucumeris (strain AG1-IB / isolate 7/3/14) TaxID=1108050 RepID=M5BKQ9_THACB|nr:hypothetical protein BN14_00746 [Rhizoctonia solani AG-1 IB]